MVERFALFGYNHLEQLECIEETEIVFKMTPCTEEDAAFIEEQTDNAFNAITQPEEDTEEEEFGDIIIHMGILSYAAARPRRGAVFR